MAEKVNRIILFILFFRLKINWSLLILKVWKHPLHIHLSKIHIQLSNLGFITNQCVIKMKDKIKFFIKL